MHFVVASLLSGLLFWHPFYVSVVELNHNAAEQTLETSVRIFTDDFENTLKMRFPGQKIDLYKTPANAQMDSLISRYLTEKMQVRLNGRVAQLRYLGFERVEESIWCYLEVTGVKSVQQLHISNRMLYEYKREQINMHHVNAAGQKKSYKLNNPETEVDFQF